MAAPFKLDQALPITRTTNGRFQEFGRAVPANPLEASEEGRQPQAWAPGVGQGKAPLSAQRVPWPAVARPSPMKFGG